MKLDPPNQFQILQKRYGRQSGSGFVYAEVIDSAGILVSNSTNKIQFELTSKGDLIGANPINAKAGIASILFKGDVSSYPAIFI